MIVKSRYLLSLLLVCALVGGCESTSDDNPDAGAAVPAVFTTSLGMHTQVDTRVWDQNWNSTTDTVAIAMDYNPLDDASSFNKYVPTKDGATGVTLRPAKSDQTLYYPLSTKTVNFTAFSPYREVEAGKITYNTFADQTTKDKVEAVDLITLDPDPNKTFTGDRFHPTVALDFVHRFCKLNINVTTSGNIDELTDMQIAINYVPTRAVYDLNEDAIEPQVPGTIRPFQTNSATTSNATAIIVPHDGYINDGLFSDRTITFLVNGLLYTHYLNDAFEFSPGTEYTMNFTVNRVGVELKSTTINAWSAKTPTYDPNQYSLTGPTSVTISSSASTAQSVKYTTNYPRPMVVISGSSTGYASTLSWVSAVSFTYTGNTLTVKFIPQKQPTSGGSVRYAYIYVFCGDMLLRTTVKQPV